MSASSEKDVVIDETLHQEVRSAIVKDLEDDGFQVRVFDSQQWPTHLGLSQPNMDGTMELFFGPIYRTEDELRISYLLVREETLREELTFRSNCSAEEISQILWARVSAHAIGRLQSSHSPSAEVGPGLDPVSKEKAELADARSDSRLGDSSS